MNGYFPKIKCKIIYLIELGSMSFYITHLISLKIILKKLKQNFDAKEALGDENEIFLFQE